MTRFLYRPQSILIISLIAILAFGCSSSAQLPPTHTEIPPASVTVVPSTVTPSPIPPTETYTMVPPTNTVAPTLTETPTSTPSSAPTDMPPSALINGDAGCRLGPGTVYKILVFVSAGDVGVMDGRTEDSTWFRIQLPDEETPCWVFGDLITQEGNPGQIAVITPVPLPTATSIPEEIVKGVKYYLIIPDNGGPFACGDGIAYFQTSKKVEGNLEKIKAALNALFSVDTEYIGQYYNPLYKSSLHVGSVEIDGSGNIVIKMSGKLARPQTECEAKRIRTQVWETAGLYNEGRHINIYVQSSKLGDLLENYQK